MSLLFGRRPEARALSYTDVWGSGAGRIGDVDGIGSGLSLVPVWAATSLISDLVCLAPWTAYDKAADGSLTAMQDQPQLIANPSPTGLSLFEWRHQAVQSLLMRGNAYGVIVDCDTQANPSKVLWLNPDEMSIIEEQFDWYKRPTYYWRNRLIPNELLIHVRGYLQPGTNKGLSPIDACRAAIQLGSEAADHGVKWFKNGAMPAAHLKNVRTQLSPEDAEIAKDRFADTVSRGGVFVTGADWDYNALAVTTDQALFLSTIKANATQIAAIFRVSPEDVGGEVASSLTYKTLEQNQTNLTTRTIGAWAGRLDEAFTAALPAGVSVASDLDAISRGDFTTRIAANATAIASKQRTVSEVRARDHLPPLTADQLAEFDKLASVGATAMPPEVIPGKEA